MIGRTSNSIITASASKWALMIFVLAFAALMLCFNYYYLLTSRTSGYNNHHSIIHPNQSVHNNNTISNSEEEEPDSPPIIEVTLKGKSRKRIQSVSSAVIVTSATTTTITVTATHSTAPYAQPSKSNVESEQISVSINHPHHPHQPHACDHYALPGYLNLSSYVWINNLQILQQNTIETQQPKTLCPPFPINHLALINLTDSSSTNIPSSNNTSLPAKQQQTNASAIKQPPSKKIIFPSYLRNKLTLLIGDCQDRNIITTLCAHLNGSETYHRLNGTLLPDTLDPQIDDHTDLRTCVLRDEVGNVNVFMNMFHFGVLVGEDTVKNLHRHDDSDAFPQTAFARLQYVPAMVARVLSQLAPEFCNSSEFLCAPLIKYDDAGSEPITRTNKTHLQPPSHRLATDVSKSEMIKLIKAQKSANDDLIWFSVPTLTTLHSLLWDLQSWDEWNPDVDIVELAMQKNAMDVWLQGVIANLVLPVHDMLHTASKLAWETSELRKTTFDDVEDSDAAAGKKTVVSSVKKIPGSKSLLDSTKISQDGLEVGGGKKPAPQKAGQVPINPRRKMSSSNKEKVKASQDLTRRSPWQQQQQSDNAAASPDVQATYPFPHIMFRTVPTSSESAPQFAVWTEEQMNKLYTDISQMSLSRMREIAEWEIPDVGEIEDHFELASRQVLDYIFAATEEKGSMDKSSSVESDDEGVATSSVKGEESLNGENKAEDEEELTEQDATKAATAEVEDEEPEFDLDVLHNLPDGRVRIRGTHLQGKWIHSSKVSTLKQQHHQQQHKPAKFRRNNTKAKFKKNPPDNSGKDVSEKNEEENTIIFPIQGVLDWDKIVKGMRMLKMDGFHTNDDGQIAFVQRVLHQYHLSSL